MATNPSRRLLSLAGAVASGLMLFVAGEPLAIGALAYLALIPLLVAILCERRRAWAALYGFVFGCVYFGVHLAWIFLFGWMAWTGLVIVMALYTTVAAYLGCLVRRFPFSPALLAGAWAGVELVRDRWPYGGYSWGTVGTTQATVPGVRWLAGVVGVYGLTLLVVFVGALLADRIVAGHWSWGAIAVVACGLLLFVGADLVGYGRPPVGRAMRLLVVQGGVPRPPRPDQQDVILNSHIRLTRRGFEALSAAGRRRPDLVVWPETSIGAVARAGAEQEVKRLARESHTPFLVGRAVLTGDGGFRNTVESITADGERSGVYVKRHPVPFGEYVPISFFRRFVSTLQEEIPVDLRAGREPTIFGIDHTKVAAPICFESVFPRDIRDFARLGAELYVVETNNASFEHSYASQQHLAHARMRALETRQWVVQAGLAGISGVLTPDGRVEHATKLFRPTSFVADVRVRGPHSLYERVGDLFPFLFALGALAAIALWLFTIISGRLRG